MKIVLTVHQFLPDFSSGTEILTFETAKELLRRGHNIEIWTGYPASTVLEDSERFDSYEFEGLTVRRFHHNYNQPIRPSNVIEAEYNNLFLGDHFHDYLKTSCPDLVHFFHLSRLSASPINACRALNIPTVFTATDFWSVCPTSQLRQSDNSLCTGPKFNGVNCLRHVVDSSQPPEIKSRLNSMPDWLVALFIWGTKQSWWPEKQYSPFVRALARRPSHLIKTMNTIDRVLVPTRLMEEILKKNGLKQQHMRFVPFGINLKYMEKVPLKNPSNLIRLGFIGTLYEHKGAHILLEAVRILPQDLPIEINVYGKLNEFPKYVDQIKEIAADDKRIRFCGTFPNQDIGIIFSQLDALVVPSIWYENTPLVIYSAQATGTPVIATNLGGMAEVVQHEKNGLLFEKGNVAGLANLIKGICVDRSLLPRLSANAVKPKSIPTYVDELEEIYREIFSERRMTQ